MDHTAIQGRIISTVVVEAHDEAEYHRLVADVLERLAEYATIEDCRVVRVEGVPA